MKTYHERLRSIQKKAKAKKLVQSFTRATVSVLCLGVILCAALLLPQADRFLPMVNPGLNNPYGSTSGTQQQDPTGTTSNITIIDPPIPITSPTSPGNTQGPPNNSEKPYAYFDFEAFHFRISQSSGRDDYPGVHLIQSVEDTTDFCTAYNQEYHSSKEMKEHLQKYDSEYFYTKSLIVLMLVESSGSVHHNVANVAMYSNNVVNVELEWIVPEVGTCDMAYWYIFVEVDALLPEDAYICCQRYNVPPETTTPEHLADRIPADLKDVMKYEFIKQFTDHSEGYTADDVSIERVISIFDNRYALFIDGIFMYLEWIESEFVNGYKFTYGSSQKMYLYADGYYYRLQEAYDAGLLSDSELQQLYDAYYEINKDFAMMN